MGKLARFVRTSFGALALFFIVAFGSAPMAYAVTLEFEVPCCGTYTGLVVDTGGEYIFDAIEINNANIDSGSGKPSAKLQPSPDDTVMQRIDEGAFTLSSIYYDLFSDQSTFRIEGFLNIGDLVPLWFVDLVSPIGGATWECSGATCAAIEQVRFASTDTSNLRFDDISVTAVPLPAALPLLASVFGFWALIGWRRGRVAAV